MSNSPEIGRVIGTERKPNTAYTFTFWTPPTERRVGIGTLVKVVSAGPDGDEELTFGVVTEAHGFNDLDSPLHEFMAFDGLPDREAPTLRPEMRVYQAAVLRRHPEEPISAVPIGRVHLAEDQDVRRALRTDGYAEEFGIPAGCYGTKGNPLPVHLHRQFLLGPEAGHLNMTGTSGLAAKTSFILFLLQSIFSHARDDDTGGQKGVAALLFNTKGGDLLYLDQPGDPPTDLDVELYKACEIEPRPFERVRYFAPYDPNGVDLNSLRRNDELEAGNPTQPLTFGLSDVVRHLDVLLNRDDIDAKADGYLAFLNEEYVKKEIPRVEGDPEAKQPITIDELVAICRRHKDLAEQDRGYFRNHHQYTIGKIINRLDSLGYRFRGLIAPAGARSTGPLESSFEDRTIYVVDVAQLNTDEQNLVFAAMVSKLRQKMEDQQLGVAKLVVVVDELNKYAPSGGSDNTIAKSLREIAARGRYLGLTLFGAQQFRSRVDKEIVGNAATHAFGHIEVEELSQPGYSYFSAAVKEKLGAMEPGEVLIKHPHFAQPIFIRFPRPSVMKGSDGMRVFPRRGHVPLRTRILQKCRTRGHTDAEIEAALQGVMDSDESLLKILRELERAGPSDNLLDIIRWKGLRQKAPTEAKSQPTHYVPDENDPFDEGAH